MLSFATTINEVLAIGCSMGIIFQIPSTIMFIVLFVATNLQRMLLISNLPLHQASPGDGKPTSQQS